MQAVATKEVVVTMRAACRVVATIRAACRVITSGSYS